MPDIDTIWLATCEDPMGLDHLLGVFDNRDKAISVCEAKFGCKLDWLLSQHGGSTTNAQPVTYTVLALELNETLNSELGDLWAFVDSPRDILKDKTDKLPCPA